MLNAIIDWSLRYRFLVLALTGLLIVTGIYSASQLPVDAFPDTTPVQVQINTVAPALTPLEIEQQITFPVEQSISGLKSLKEVRSISKFGLSQVTVLFEDGVDIHAMTASEMFSVPVEGMPPEVRRRAKAINFGIIYGISAFGLANQLGIERSEASEYISKYFERFPGIRDYMENTKAFCREHGYVETIFGRRAHYPEIRASNPQHRAFSERAAINAPIQGSAADIIRRAMVRMDAALDNARLANVQMLLQVHDELIFEAPEAEVEQAMPVICDIMENAAMPAISMAVPLHVDARAADNWDEAH